MTSLSRQRRVIMNSLGKLGAAFCLTLSLTAEVLAAETVQINFRDADIRSVIERVAEITDKSFVLDP